jgi:hypothetical protein
VIKQDGPLEPRRAAEIGRQMLAALHAAHGAGVLHRDVKPSNVLITGTGRMGERAVLTDFGIATASGDATLTQTGLVMGSPAYIAPERARGRVAGPASDLWSLGVTLYAMLHGRSPFERPEPMAALVAVISEEPDPPEKGGRLVPVIDGLLRKNPDQRMDAIEAGALLDDIVRQETVDTQRTMAVEFSMDELPGPQTTARDSSYRSRPYAEAYAEPYPETYAPDQPLPDEVDDSGGGPGVGEPGVAEPGVPEPGVPDPGVTAASPEARPDQLTSFDLPTAKARAAGPAGPGETAPDPDRAGSWRPGPRTEPAGAVASEQGPPEPGPSTHFPPTTHPAVRPTLAANRNVLIVAAIVLVVIVVIATIALASSGGGKDDDKTAPKGTAPPTGGATPSVLASSATPSASPSSGGLPAGFTLHKDPSGYSVPVPAGWSGPERKQGGEHFYSPDRKIYIQIDQTDDPGDSAIDDWRDSARNVARFPGYKKIRIAPTGDHPPVPDTGDGDDSADWEFTYNGNGGRVHVLNRGFVTNGHGYAILLSAPDADWSKVYADLQPVYEHFTPADDD